MMKLIDILVRELPIRGGWPEDSNEMFQSAKDSEIYTNSEILNDFYVSEIASDRGLGTQTTRQQYEAALAASKLEWDGSGLPPVGCECEYKDQNNGEWYKVSIKYQSDWVVVISGRNFAGEMVEIAKCLVLDVPEFRPIRSKADRKRDEAINAMRECLGHASGLIEVSNIYTAIAAGKIPGVKLED